MLKVKVITGLVLMTGILVLVTSTALAAPNTQALVAVTTTTTPAPTATSLTGTVQTITPITDANNVVTGYQVTLIDQNNVTQTVTLTLAEAQALNLVTVTNGVATVNTAMIGQTVTVQSTATPTPTETAQNPVGAVIASFFGLDYSTVEEMHQDGTGYGVIAQACWMSYELNGNGSACADIVAAKKSGDYSTIKLPDGSTPTNWGQFKKAASDQKSPGETLGAIMSGHAKAITTVTPEPTSGTPSVSSQSQTGNGNSNGQGNGNGNNGQGNGKGKSPDKKNNGKGHNK